MKILVVLLSSMILTGCIATTKAVLSGAVPPDAALREMTIEDVAKTLARKSKGELPGVEATLQHPVIVGMITAKRTKRSGFDEKPAEALGKIAELSSLIKTTFEVTLIFNTPGSQGIVIVDPKEWAFWMIHSDGTKEILKPAKIYKPNYSIVSASYGSRTKWTRLLTLKSSRPFIDKGHLTLFVGMRAGDSPPFKFSWDLDRKGAGTETKKNK